MRPADRVGGVSRGSTCENKEEGAPACREKDVKNVSKQQVRRIPAEAHDSNL